SRECCPLIREPILTSDHLSAPIRPAPRAHGPALEQGAEGGDRADRVESPLVVPAAHARVEDRVCQREEELDVGIEPITAVAVVVAARYELSEQVPVSGWKLGMRSVR